LSDEAPHATLKTPSLRMPSLPEATAAAHVDGQPAFCVAHNAIIASLSAQ